MILLEFVNQEDTNIFEKASEKRNKRSSSVYQNPMKVDISKQEEFKNSKEKDLKQNIDKDQLLQNDRILIKSKIRSRQGISRAGLQSQRSINVNKNDVYLLYLNSLGGSRS